MTEIDLIKKFNLSGDYKWEVKGLIEYKEGNTILVKYEEFDNCGFADAYWVITDIQKEDPNEDKYTTFETVIDGKKVYAKVEKRPYKE